MNPNQELIHTFYQAFQNKDFETMNACYSEEVLFSDPVFPDLNHEQVCAMWEMLIKRGKDLELTFDNIQANEHSGSADWIATYSFGTKKNKVVNHIHATFEFSEGKDHSTPWMNLVFPAGRVRLWASWDASWVGLNS